LRVVLPTVQQVQADDAGRFIVTRVVNAHEFTGPADFFGALEELFPLLGNDLAEKKGFCERPKGVPAGEGGGVYPGKWPQSRFKAVGPGAFEIPF
jgi:hypothetical protein